MKGNSIIDLRTKMDAPNDNILIYQGDFFIRQYCDELRLTGNIYFNWLPSPGVRFQAVCNDKNPRPTYEYIKKFQDSDCFDVYVLDMLIGKAQLTRFTIGSDITLKGKVFDATLGEKTIVASEIDFCLPNLKSFLGETVSKKAEQSIQKATNRLSLKNSKYEIRIDFQLDNDQRWELLHENGGFLIIAAGKLIPRNGKIDILEGKKVLNVLGDFLSFINGRRTAPMFLKGLFLDEEVWSCYAAKHIDIYKYKHSWSNERSIEGFNDLWQTFYEFYLNETDQDFLSTALHWYLEANNNSGYAEGALILAQTNLELIYNWLIVERKKSIIGDDSRKISASNKIRLLLSQFDCNCQIPNAFAELNNYRKAHKLDDGPEAIVQIRNAIVHSQLEKRKNLRTVNAATRVQALELSIWYTEIAILNILKFKGTYYNRCNNKIEKFG